MGSHACGGSHAGGGCAGAARLAFLKRLHQPPLHYAAQQLPFPKQPTQSPSTPFVATRDSRHAQPPSQPRNAAQCRGPGRPGAGHRTCHRLGKQRLAGAGRAHQQHAAGRPRTQARKLLGGLEEVLQGRVGCGGNTTQRLARVSFGSAINSWGRQQVHCLARNPLPLARSAPHPLTTTLCTARAAASLS
jgi:hypothetical protein